MKDPISLTLWNRKGRPVPPPSSYKRQVVLAEAKKYGIKTMIETGTFKGDMGFAMKDRFSRFVTIELSSELHAAAVHRLSRFKNIECKLGDSGTLLPSLIATLDEPCLFWLDAHYSGNVTAQGEVDTPISIELEAILKHRIRNHVILIDDARCFDGTNNYPRLSDLRDSVSNLRPELSFSAESDIIRILP